MFPKDWQRSTIGDCTKFLSGNTPSKENLEFWFGDFPWVTVKDMKTPWLHNTGLGLTQSGKAAASVAPTNAINTNGEIDLRFLRYLSESRYFQQTCFHSSIGVHVEKMIFKTERWLTWPFNIPPLAQQTNIVEILDAASKETALIKRQLIALKQEKSALMSQLLTGKRRVRLDTEAGASSS